MSARYVCVELFGRSAVADDRTLLKSGEFLACYAQSETATFGTAREALLAGIAARGRRPGARLSAYEIMEPRA